MHTVAHRCTYVLPQIETKVSKVALQETFYEPSHDVDEPSKAKD